MTTSQINYEIIFLTNYVFCLIDVKLLNYEFYVCC